MNSNHPVESIGESDEERSVLESKAEMPTEEDSYTAAVLALIEIDRAMVEKRATKLRILRDIVKDKFDAVVMFEQHYAGNLTVVSSFAVFHADKGVRSEVKTFVKTALNRIDVPIKWEGRDVKEIPLRKEPASSHEKLHMISQIYG